MVLSILLLTFAAQGGGDYAPSHEIPGNHGGAFGTSVAQLADLDGDGVPEFAVGAPLENHPPFWGPPGAVHVYSGSTMALIHEFFGTLDRQGFGNDVANAGDVDGDGVEDIIIGTWDLLYPGSAFVYSGANGALLYQYTGTELWEGLGETVSGLDDVDGDGFDDFLIAATGYSPPGLDRTGAVFAYSGKTGNLLYRVDGTAYVNSFGIDIAIAEDLDGDGVRDFLVGEPGADPWFPQAPARAGVVRAFSGASGQEIFQIPGLSANGSFGSSVSAAGDLDGDGVNDIAVGAPWEKGPGRQIHVGGAYLFSGATLAFQRRFAGDQENGDFGTKVLIVPDLNQDGILDLLISESEYDHDQVYNTGSVHLFSGQSGMLLQRWYGPSSSSYFGSDMVSLGDLNGDAQQEWLIGAKGILSNGSVRGGAFAYSFDPLMQADVSEISGILGGVMHLELNFPNEEANTPYRILLSTTGIGPTRAPGAQIPLSLDNVFRRSLAGEYPPMMQDGSGFLDAFGNASARFTVPPQVPPALLNTTRWFAAATLDPGTGRVRRVSIPLPLKILP